MNAFLWAAAILCTLSVLGEFVKAWNGSGASWIETANASVNAGMAVWALCLLFK